MLWLTYRQHRIELAVALVGALVIALAFLAAAQYVWAVRVDVGLTDCPIINTQECSARLGEYLRRTGQLTGMPLVLYVYPIVVAAFLAGPMFARDFERGTHRLVWTQGITRTRWVSTKLFIVLAAAVVAAVVLASVGGHAGQLMNGRSDPWRNFNYEGPAFISYLVFAIALGAASGVLFRRTLLAMLATLLLFAGTRILVEWKLRPNYLPTVTTPAGGTNIIALPQDAWHLGVRYVYGSGADYPQDQFGQLMRDFRGGDLYTYLQSHDVFAMSFYQPADRYWLFQSIEAVIFFVLSAILLAFSVWLIARRPA
jgi:hypothetical protein